MDSVVLDSVMAGLVGFVRRYRGLTPYPYQLEFARGIIEAALDQAAVDEVGEFSRQSGKTEDVADVVSFLNIYAPTFHQRLGLHVWPNWQTVIFAPQQEQAKTDFDRIKEVLGPACADMGISVRESNANTLTLGNGSRTFCFTLSPTSHPESKTANMVILEESQDLLDQRIDKVALPMGSNTKAARVYVGTAGYRKCRLWDLVEGGRALAANVHRADVHRVIDERRTAYDRDGDRAHLAYEEYVASIRPNMGPDEWATQYELRWKIGVGQFITFDQWQALAYKAAQPKYVGPVHIGIDWAKDVDRTVAIAADPSRRWVGCLPLHGIDYITQRSRIRAWVEKNQGWQPHSVTMDATAQGGDVLLEQCKTEWPNTWHVTGYKFTQQSKHDLYTNLHNVISEATAQKRQLWPAKGDDAARMCKEMCDLQKETKNGLWSVHHPEGAGYHDDYPDAYALAVWGATRRHPRGNPRTKSTLIF